VHQAGRSIVINNATKYYETRTGRVHALDNFSATIGEGELVCVLGPSGCGKSTLLWAMGGLHPLTSGEVLVGGRPVTGPRPEIGMIFQDANLLPWRTLYKNVVFPLEIKGLSIKQYEPRVRQLLEMVGLSGFANKYPRELSGGMQQRASIARGLSFDPSILLMDEPFGALDAFTRDEMNLLLQQIWMETRKTIVFITHNIAEAIFLADRILVMTPRPGRLARIFTIDFPRPRTLEITTEPEFLDIINEVKTVIEQGAGAEAFYELELQ